MYNKLKEKGRAASDHYAGSKEYFTLTPASKSLLDGLMPVIQTHCRGRLLDAGAGRGAYRDLLHDYVDEYIGLDVTASKATTAVGDAQKLPFASESFDTVFCSQVLEHVPEPWSAIADMHRVLNPGGYLILTVPHISWLHNEPHDYYRYTGHGLRFLLRKAGFEEIEIRPAGGLLSLFGHIFSTLWVNLSFGIPVVHSLVKLWNLLWVKVLTWLDRHIEKKKVFALNYVCVARKPKEL